MNNEITQPVRAIKSLAKQMLKGKYLLLVLVVLVCNIMCLIPEYLAETFIKNDIVLFIIEIASYILEIYINFSLIQFFMAVFRSQKYTLDDFFSNGRFLKTAVIAELISTVEIFLMSILLIVPGIICAIKHSQIMYVLADNPDFTPTECINKSHEIMEGNKMKYFSLELSFIPLSVLAQLPLRLYENYCGPKLGSYIISTSDLQATLEGFNEYLTELSEFENTPIALLLSCVSIFVTVYMSMSCVAFYDIASGNLVVADQDELQNVRYVVDLAEAKNAEPQDSEPQDAEVQDSEPQDAEPQD